MIWSGAQGWPKGYSKDFAGVRHITACWSVSISAGGEYPQEKSVLHGTHAAQELCSGADRPRPARCPFPQ